MSCPKAAKVRSRRDDSSITVGNALGGGEGGLDEGMAEPDGSPAPRLLERKDKGSFSCSISSSNRLLRFFSDASCAAFPSDSKKSRLCRVAHASPPCPFVFECPFEGGGEGAGIRGASATGTETKSPKSESAALGRREWRPARVACGDAEAPSFAVGSKDVEAGKMGVLPRLGEARGVGGWKRVAKRSSSASRLLGLGEDREEEGVGMRAGMDASGSLMVA